jgi:hypothetical protein
MKKIKQPKLIRENHPESYKGYKFITLIKYNGETYLNIVDNVVNNNIVAYVIDLCNSAEVDELKLIEIADNWFSNNKDKHPFSIELSRKGLSNYFNKILRNFPIDYVTRVIGPLPEFNMGGPKKIKRKKKKSISKNIKIVIKNSESQV